MVNDVNATLFPGANLDSRTGGIVNGTFRLAVLGTRTSQRASDGNVYSRALQTNTLHYYRITCDGQATLGSFTTANIPIGMTHSDPPQADPQTPGQTLLPTQFDVRGTTVVDPQTGALLKRVSVLEDAGATYYTGPFLDWGGFIRVCSANLTGPGPGYLCALPNSGGGYGILYYIIPSTGEVRYLGLVSGNPYPSFDPVDNQVYTVTTAGTVSTIIRGTYVGSYLAVPTNTNASFTWETFYQGSPTDLVRAFDPTMPSVYGCTFNVGGPYALLVCERGYQDSFGWLAVMDMGNRMPIATCGGGAGCPKIIAAANVTANAQTRWCGLHNIQLMPGAVVSITTHGMLGPANSPGQGPYLSTLTSGITATQTSISVSGDPVATPADPYLPTAQVGDWFNFTDNNEQVQLVKKVSPTSWVISRPATATAHASGAQLVANCNVGGFAGFGMAYWKFLQDPHGTDTTNTNYIADHYWPMGGHDDWGPNLRVTEAYEAVIGPLASMLNTPISVFIDSSPSFAGVTGIAYGNSTDKHPSYHQSAAPPVDQNWFLDYPGFAGGNLYSDSPGAVAISNQLYQYRFPAWAPASSPGLASARKALSTLALSGQHPLIDISGPGSVLGDSAQYSYNYCIAYLANECHPGSQPGDIFANVPNLQYLSCTSSLGAADLCIASTPTFVQGVAQMGLQGADGYSRLLSGGLTGLRVHDGYPLAKSLPDASWALISNLQPNAGAWWEQVWMLKLPPYQRNDSLDRSGFLPLQVSLAKPTDPRVVSAVVEFGYAEYGSPSAHFCTSRREACVAVTAALNQAAPFQYETSDSYSRTPCTSGCTIVVPALPMHVVYYQPKYLDANGNVIALGPRGVSAEISSANESATPPAVLSVATANMGNFMQGQSGSYSLTVSNSTSAGATNGAVTVTEVLPSGLNLISMSGKGWTCPIGATSCTRSDVLPPNGTYLPITVTVGVATSAASPQVNSVLVSGGGSAPASAIDPTTILAPASAPILSAVAPASGIQGASVSVVLTGANFGTGVTVVTNNSGIVVTGVTVLSSTQISATFGINSRATTGATSVTVTTGAGASGSVVFTVNPPPSGVTLVQPVKVCPNASTCSFPVAPRVGDQVVVLIAVDGFPTSIAATDNQGNAYTAFPIATGTYRSTLKGFITGAVVSAGTFTVSSTDNGTARTIMMYEYSGLSTTFDGSAQNYGTETGNTGTCGTLTTANSTDLIVAAATASDTNINLSSFSSPFTFDAVVSNSAAAILSGHYISSAATSGLLSSFTWGPSYNVGGYGCLQVGIKAK